MMKHSAMGGSGGGREDLRERGCGSFSLLVGGQSEPLMALIFLWKLCGRGPAKWLFFSLFLYYQCSIFNLGEITRLDL